MISFGWEMLSLYSQNKCSSLEGELSSMCTGSPYDCVRFQHPCVMLHVELAGGNNTLKHKWWNLFDYMQPANPELLPYIEKQASLGHRNSHPLVDVLVESDELCLKVLISRHWL